MRWFDRLLSLIERLAMVAVGIAFALIMLVMTVDAFGRYAFNAPLPFTHELVTGYLMVAASLLALSATLAHGEHVSIDVFVRRMPRRVRLAAQVATGVLGLLFIAAVGYQGLSLTLESLSSGEVKPGVILWPVWITYAFIPLGFGILMLRLTHMTVDAALRLAGAASAGEGEDDDGEHATAPLVDADMSPHRPG